MKSKSSYVEQRRRNNRKKNPVVRSNPFELRINKQKFSILGRKSKNDKGLPGLSRSKAIKKVLFFNVLNFMIFQFIAHSQLYGFLDRPCHYCYIFFFRGRQLFCKNTSKGIRLWFAAYRPSSDFQGT